MLLQVSKESSQHGKLPPCTNA